MSTLLFPKVFNLMIRTVFRSFTPQFDRLRSQVRELMIRFHNLDFTEVSLFPNEKKRTILILCMCDTFKSIIFLSLLCNYYFFYFSGH